MGCLSLSHKKVINLVLTIHRTGFGILKKLWYMNALRNRVKLDLESLGNDPENY